MHFIIKLSAAKLQTGRNFKDLFDQLFIDLLPNVGHFDPNTY